MVKRKLIRSAFMLILYIFFFFHIYNFRFILYLLVSNIRAGFCKAKGCLPIVLLFDFGIGWIKLVCRGAQKTIGIVVSWISPKSLLDFCFCVHKSEDRGGVKGLNDILVEQEGFPAMHNSIWQLLLILRDACGIVLRLFKNTRTLTQ